MRELRLIPGCVTLGVLLFATAAGAQGVRDKTIVYRTSGVLGGTYKIYIAPSGTVFETNLSGGGGLSGYKYRIGRTITEKNSYTGTAGDHFTCDVRSTASLSKAILELQAHSSCFWGRGSALNGNFNHRVRVEMDGDHCRASSYY